MFDDRVAVHAVRALAVNRLKPKGVSMERGNAGRERHPPLCRPAPGRASDPLLSKNRGPGSTVKKGKLARWGSTALLLTLVIIPAQCTREKGPTAPVERVYSEQLLIGLIPEHNVFTQLERYEPLASYLSGKVGVEVKLKILSRYGNIIDNFVSLGLDGAFFGSFTYGLAHAKLGLDVLARPESADGVSSYYGLIFVRKASGIASAADMKGKRFAFVDKATTAGYLLPLVYFKENGIPDYREYFSETYFTGTHEDSIYDVLNGRADVGAAKNTVYYRIAQSDSRLLNDLEILAQSPSVPENALAVRGDLDGELKDRLKTVLLTMHQDPEGEAVLRNFGVSRFIETVNEDYAPVYDYAELAGLELATYDWVNE